jgi:hypothetical protein
VFKSWIFKNCALKKFIEISKLLPVHKTTFNSVFINTIQILSKSDNNWRQDNCFVVKAWFYMRHLQKQTKIVWQIFFWFRIIFCCTSMILWDIKKKWKEYFFVIRIKQFCCKSTILYETLIKKKNTINSVMNIFFASG